MGVLCAAVAAGSAGGSAWGMSDVVGARAGGAEAGAALPMDFEFSEEVRKRVLSELGLRDARIQRLEIGAHPAATAAGIEGVLQVQVDLEGHARTLVLEPHALRSEGFAVYVGFGPGANDFAPIDRAFAVTTYRGWVELEEWDLAAKGEVPDPKVVGSYFGGRLRASVYDLPAPAMKDGAPLAQRSTTAYRVQPLSDVIAGADPAVYVVYRDSDTRRLEGYRCGVEDEHRANEIDGGGEGGEAPIGDRGVPACLKIADLIYDTDYEFTTHFIGRPDPIGEMLADIEFINNECDFLFQRDMGAAHNVKGVVLRTNPNDPYTDATAHGTLLTQFRAVWAGVPLSNPERDITHMMTGRDLDGGVIGVAYLASVCRQDPNVGLSQTFFTSAANRRIMLTAHELGHQWNAPHDNQEGSACAHEGSGFIMNPSIGSQPLLFSDCSKDRMTTYLASTSGACVSGAALGPQVRADYATVYVGDTVDVDVLRNDASHCGPLSFALGSSTSAQGGTLTLFVGAGPRGRNLVRYTPAAGFTGVDTFTYTATNGVSTSAPVTATVLVVPRKGAEFPLRIGTGMHVYYYDTISPLGILPDFSTMTPYLTGAVGTVSFASTSGNFAGSGRADEVSAVFEGFFNVTTAGIYTFFTESDDGSKLFIGETLVVSNDGIHGMQEKSGKIGLDVGRHSIRVEFFERNSSAGLIARVQGPGLTKQTLPSSRLTRRLVCGTDLNGDDAIDLTDLLIFLEDWLPALGGEPGESVYADRNNDGVVDLADLLHFLQPWQSQLCQ